MSTSRTALSHLSASELARLYRQGDLSPVEVARTVLERSAQRQGDVNAFAALDEAGALAAARASERRFRDRSPLGPLDGVPVSVKDLVDVQGFVTRQGSLTTAGRAPAAQDAPAIEPLRRQGALLFGKTTTHEFGLGSAQIPHTGFTRNPWRLTHRPGGSSAGAVAAVAAGLGPLAVGTDGGGSIREPAAYTGLVGLKPSYGRVPLQVPALAGAPPLVGPIARSVVDAALLFRALAGPHPRDPYALPADWRVPQAEGPLADWRGLRIAAAPTFNGTLPTDEVVAAFEAAVAVFEALGATVTRAAPPDAPDSARRLMLARAALTLKPLDEARRTLVDPAVQRAAREGAQLTAVDLAEAEAERAAYTAEVAAFFESHDLLLTPTTAQVAPPVEGPPPAPARSYTSPFSWTRQPALSVPAGLGAESGLPVGLQLVARRFEDELLLAAAEAYEAAAPQLATLRAPSVRREG